jgi:hypothetical protein
MPAILYRSEPHRPECQQDLARYANKIDEVQHGSKSRAKL